ncbi:hypothetical protein O0L34_g14030 [Tuta absoluta]|nr:hypothetical protein O0L34_g14030 [Tuta absoluta]
MIEATKRKVAIALIQEPYVGASETMKSYSGVRIFQHTGPGTVKAAIAIFDPDLDITQHPDLTTNNVTVVSVSTKQWTLTLTSFYFEPDKPIKQYLDQLTTIAGTIKQKLIIGGDANAKSTWWGSTEIDHEGEDMAGTLHELDLQILNKGDTPTFDTVRGGKLFTSFVDVTACTTDLLDLVEDWTVIVNLTSSDHNGIAFTVNVRKSAGVSVKRTTRLYNTKKADWKAFQNELNRIKTAENLNINEISKISTVEQLEQFIESHHNATTKACNLAIPKKKNTETLTLPWWTEELKKMKQEVTTKKRRIGVAAPIRKQRVVDAYLEAKDRYETKAKEAQIKSWMEFCNKQDKENLWQGIYRVIGRTVKREEDELLQQNGITLDAKSSVELLAKTFYPDDLEEDDNPLHRDIRTRASTVNKTPSDEQNDPPFTATELCAALDSFNPKKAPGSDGFTSDICSNVIKSDPKFFLAILNKCLDLNYFPAIWKKATVIVLRKPGKDTYTNPKSYRPIGLLPVMGKIYEKMLVARLKYYLLPRLNSNQFGFMPQKSCEDALYKLMQHINAKLDEKKLIAIVSLDIEGAFDSAWWPAIRVRLAEGNCPTNIRKVIDSYLEQRTVTVRYGGETYTKATNKGCVQGSIGGPILWNVLLNPLLNILESEGHYVQAFADDVVMVFDGKTAQHIQRQANAALEHVRVWGVENKLKFAPHKTNAMIITRKLKFDIPHLSMGGIDIGMSREIKMLGVIFDDKLTFNMHVAYTCKKAINIFKQLSRAAKASWGLHPEVIRTIYTATIEPIILYAASVWGPAAEKLGVQKQLGTVQRGFAQKMCKAYRTVSLNSALVLAGVLPLDLRVKEAASLHRIKGGATLPILGDREIERQTPATEVPHPAVLADLKITNLRNREDVEENSSCAVKIFTDGSKIGGRVGAALSVWESDAEIRTVKLCLPSYCTVYQAELLAIREATRRMRTNGAVSFGIYSDSMAALQTVTNLGSLHPLAVESRENITYVSRQNKAVSLYWIKAHAGLEGNERADQLAKEAAAASMKQKPHYDLFPISFAKRQLRLESICEWDKRYKSSEVAGTTKIFFPDVTTAYRVIRKFEPTFLSTQLLTGHGGFSEYLCRFKCKESPSCICDPNVNESVPHIIMECPAFGLDRFEIESKLDIKITADNIQCIMLDKRRKVFMNYCLKIIGNVNKRNKL